MRILFPSLKKMLYCDIMKRIRWSDLCHRGECLHIATIETGRMSTPARHRHDFFECFLVLEGRGIHCTTDGEAALERGGLAFVRPEHEHTIRGRDDLVFLNLAFKAGTFEAAFPLAQLPEACWKRNLPVHSTRLNEAQVRRLVRAASKAAVDRGRRGAAWLLLGIGRILGGIEGGGNEAATLPDWFVEGLNKASDNREVLEEGLPGLMRLMGRSREHVSRGFRQHLGTTAGAWLRHERVRRARLLLTTTRLSVLEVALDCGFASPSHFHKCFREELGTTPLRFRKNLSRVQA